MYLRMPRRFSLRTLIVATLLAGGVLWIAIQRLKVTVDQPVILLPSGRIWHVSTEWLWGHEIARTFKNELGRTVSAPTGELVLKVESLAEPIPNPQPIFR